VLGRLKEKRAKESCIDSDKKSINPGIKTLIAFPVVDLLFLLAPLTTVFPWLSGKETNVFVRCQIEYRRSNGDVALSCVY